MKLKELIRDSCISVEKLSRKSGVTRTTIYNVLADKHEASLLTIKKICKALGKNYKNYID